MEKATMFEQAVRTKLRFPLNGSVSVEELWEASETQLQQCFGVLNRQQKDEADDVLGKETRENKKLALQIEIVKYVYATKVTEREAQVAALENNREAQKYLRWAEEAEDKEKRNLSPEELRAMAAAKMNV